MFSSEFIHLRRFLFIKRFVKIVLWREDRRRDDLLRAFINFREKPLLSRMAMERHVDIAQGRCHAAQRAA